MYKTRKIHPIVDDYGAPSMTVSFANSETRTGFFCTLHGWQYGSTNLNNLYQTIELSFKPEFFTSYPDITKKRIIKDITIVVDDHLHTKIENLYVINW